MKSYVRIECFCFADTFFQNFQIFLFHKTAHAEGVNEPPYFSDEAAHEKPENNISDRLAEIEVMAGKKNPENISRGSFLFP